MKTYKDFLDNDGTFDAKAFLTYNIRLFNAFRKQIDEISRQGLPGGESLKTAFEGLESELLRQNDAGFHPESLSERYDLFRDAADSWSAANIDAQDTVALILSVQEPVDGENCTFSDFLNENTFSAQALSEEILGIKAEPAPAEPESEFSLFTSGNAPKEPENEFSLFTSDERDEPKPEENKHPDLIPDSAFPAGSPKNIMRKMGIDEDIFPHGDPDPRDIVQQEDGSCFMLGNLWSMASRRPQMIRDLITDNKDGTVTVHFFKGNDNKTPHNVTVEKSLPGTDPQSAPWVRLVEKAYMASRMKVSQATHTVEPVDMTHLGWYDPSYFMNNILPGNIQPGPVEPEILEQPSFDASKQKFAEMLREAQRSDSVITITSAKHVMSFVGVEDRDGKTYINYHDQYSRRPDCSISVDDLFSPNSKLDMINVTRFDKGGSPVYQCYSPQRTAKRAKDLDEPLNRDSFRSVFKPIYRDSLNKDIKSVYVDGSPEGSKIIARFGDSSAVDTLLNNEFASCSFKNTTLRGFLADLNTPGGQQYKKAMMDKIEEAFIVDIHTRSPETAGHFRWFRAVNGRPIFGDPAGSQQEHEQKEPPKQEEEKQRTEEEKRVDVCYQAIESDLSALETSRRTRTNNSPEFNAMIDAIRDLSYARKNGVSQERLAQLEQRAYVKCKYYEDHRNPFTPEGKTRKWLAGTVKRAIEEANPSVARRLKEKPSPELVSAEIAAHLADDMIRKHPESFRRSPEDPSVDEDIRAKLVDQWARNSELRRFAGSLKLGTTEAFLGEMCKKGMPELLTKAVTKNLLSPMTGETVEFSAKETRTAETTFGIRPGGPAR